MPDNNKLIVNSSEALVVMLLGSLLLELEKRKQRHQLLQLEDHMLKDIGITKQQAIDEAKQ